VHYTAELCCTAQRINHLVPNTLFLSHTTEHTPRRELVEASASFFLELHNVVAMPLLQITAFQSGYIRRLVPSHQNCRTEELSTTMHVGAHPHLCAQGDTAQNPYGPNTCVPHLGKGSNIH
jgi:hypothetical protein